MKFRTARTGIQLIATIYSYIFFNCQHITIVLHEITITVKFYWFLIPPPPTPAYKDFFLHGRFSFLLFSSPQEQNLGAHHESPSYLNRTRIRGSKHRYT